MNNDGHDNDYNMFTCGHADTIMDLWNDTSSIKVVLGYCDDYGLDPNLAVRSLIVDASEVAWGDGYDEGYADASEDYEGLSDDDE